MKFFVFAALQTLIGVLFWLGIFLPLSGFIKPGAQIFVIIALGLSCGTSILAYGITNSGIKNNIRRFTTYLIGGMVIKLFAGIISVTVIALAFREFASEYVFTYFGGYLIFTGFEVFILVRNLRPHLQKDKLKSDEVEGFK